MLWYPWVVYRYLGREFFVCAPRHKELEPGSSIIRVTPWYRPFPYKIAIFIFAYLFGIPYCLPQRYLGTQVDRTSRPASGLQISPEGHTRDFEIARPLSTESSFSYFTYLPRESLFSGRQIPFRCSFHRSDPDKHGRQRAGYQRW